MSRPIRGWGGHLVFPIVRKNTNLVEGIEILLPVKFRWILFRDFREEVENVSANQRPGRPSCFSDRPEKHKLGRGRWDLASCQVSLNSIQRFQRSKKMSQPIRGQGGHLVFPNGPKNTNLVEDVELLLPVKFPWIPFSVFRGEVENVKVYAGRTDDRRCAMTIAHSSLRLRWAKKAILKESCMWNINWKSSWLWP